MIQRGAAMLFIAAATLGAAAAIRLWALQPLGFASYLHAPGATDAQIIRQYWPHRLVEPEWVPMASRGDRLMRWHMAETVARLSVVSLLWSLTVAAPFAIRRRFRRIQRSGQ